MVKWTPLAEDWSRGEPSPLAEAAARRRAAGLPLLDLVTDWPDRHGIVFPAELLAAHWDSARAALAAYRPDPRGQPSAREAVSRFDARRGVSTDPARVVLTPGTSFAYWALLRLLAEPGDDILVPRPSYPLFDDLARAAGVRLRNYHLRREGPRWILDPDEVAFQCTPRTRAVVVVSPHNPTGHAASSGELDGLAAVCRDRGLPLLVDEVFAEFPQRLARVERPAARAGAFPLVCALNGLSKLAQLPGLKAAWVSVHGDAAESAKLTEALAYLLDAFLPVSEPTQALLPPLLDAVDPVATAFAAEFRARMAALGNALAEAALPSAEPDAGVYRLIDTPHGAALEARLVELVEERGVLLHPGHLYGLDPGIAVATAVARPAALRDGIAAAAPRLRG
ncbi:MAG: pyridoxal phosphate-dependent aminotransferase [Candidatus Sumerlaeia bacterium]|nr:pyridoxal phosphate-dependent aminotransferase [Candidatus Sumerlaeia bacterium]